MTTLLNHLFRKGRLNYSAESWGAVPLVSLCGGFGFTASLRENFN
jgi:hypothetical protein